MDKQQIIDYIMHTPSNTNPAMLGQFLDEYSGESEESWSTFFEGEITAEEQDDDIYGAPLSESDYINADKIKVTFNGIEYECNKTVAEGDANIYGGSINEEYKPVFSNCPFIIASSLDNGALLFTESPGTHSIKIEVLQESESSGDWSTAEVTIINHTAISGTVRCAMVEDYIFITDITIPKANGKTNPPYSTVICHIPLYKNKYELSSSSLYFSEDFNSVERNISGNIVEDGSENFITGDCTITLTIGSVPK